MPAMMQALVANAGRRMKPPQNLRYEKWPVGQALCTARMGMAVGMAIDVVSLNVNPNPILYT